MKLENLVSSRLRVEEVARSALVPGFAGQPQRVPEALVTALADGQGDRDEVAEITRNAFGHQPPLELVLFDTDQIGGYVFESSRPPVIAGASKILSDLNDSIRRRYTKNIIFSGGGEGILLVPVGEGRRICDEIEGMYRQETIGALGVTTDHLAVSPIAFLTADSKEASPGSGVELVSGTPAVLARARDRIRRKKDGRLPGTTPVKGGESRCISCRDRAGTVPASELREELSGKLCPPCVKRWRRGRPLIAGVSFEAMVGVFAQSDGNSRSKSSYLGFVYADGNAMGALFGRLRSLAELRFLSQAVAHVFERVRDRVEERVGELFPRGEEDTQTLPSILGGGDEAIWILPAALAVNVAEELAGWVEAEAAAVPDLFGLLSRSGLRKLTVGTGLVLCEHKYPIRYQFELAEKLLKKSAKKLFYDAAPEQAPSPLDFEVLTDSSPVSEDIADTRKIVYGSEDPSFSRTCRPYTAAAFSELLGRVRAAATAKLGNAQLYALQTGAAEGKRLFLNYLLYQIVRNRKRYQPWLEALAVDLTAPGRLEEFFIHRTPTGTEATWITDALQLSPFIDKTRGARS